MSNPFIPYGHQSINHGDEKTILKALRSFFLTQGPMVRSFEKALEDYCGVKNAVSCANGTAALHLACMAIDLVPGDELITSTNTFVASANCGLYCGATPVLTDIDAKTYNMDLNDLEKTLKRKRKAKQKRVIIPVHFAGTPCDMASISMLAQKYDCLVIEDAAQAIGAWYKTQGKKYATGSCKHSDLTTFSFHPVKTMTTGEGGAVTTKSEKYFERLSILRTHGINKNVQSKNTKLEGAWYYEMQLLGYNYRLSDIHAALGLSQLKRLDAFIAKRNKCVEYYDDAFRDIPEIITPTWRHVERSAQQIYVIRINTKNSSQDRKKIFDFLLKNKIGVQIHYLPIHRQPYYKKFGFKKEDYPNAEALYQSCLTLPLYSDLKRKDQDRVIRLLKSAI